MVQCFMVAGKLHISFHSGIDDGGAASVRAIMHWQHRTICRGPNSILKNLYDVVVSKANDYISFYGLRAHGRLGDRGPLVTNQIYAHSKLMIIDDRMTLIGSANINDRACLDQGILRYDLLNYDFCIFVCYSNNCLAK
uniref:phospholipase D n=1 Tax=Arundo donax TaxID=35708 RepID=A0A0A9DI16_ARUDO